MVTLEFQTGLETQMINSTPTHQTRLKDRLSPVFDFICHVIYNGGGCSISGVNAQNHDLFHLLKFKMECKQETVY